MVLGLCGYVAMTGGCVRSFVHLTVSNWWGYLAELLQVTCRWLAADDVVTLSIPINFQIVLFFVQDTCVHAHASSCTHTCCDAPQGPGVLTYGAEVPAPQPLLKHQAAGHSSTCDQHQQPACAAIQHSSTQHNKPHSVSATVVEQNKQSSNSNVCDNADVIGQAWSCMLLDNP